MYEFKIGQQVVCINDIWIHPSWIKVPNKPILNHIYTIRDINPSFYPDYIGLYLEEVRNDPHPWNGEPSPIECPFAAARFRPLIKKKTDISELLKLTKIRELETV